MPAAPGRCRAAARTRPAPRPPAPPRARRPPAGGAALEGVEVDGDGTADLRVAALDRLAHGEIHHALAVETGGERVPDPPDRLLQLGALALDLVDLGLQLTRHVVELVAELGELVAPTDRDRLGEVPAREAAGPGQQLRDLAGEGAADDRRRDHSRDQEDTARSAGSERGPARSDRRCCSPGAAAAGRPAARPARPSGSCVRGSR